LAVAASTIVWPGWADAGLAVDGEADLTHGGTPCTQADGWRPRSRPGWPPSGRTRRRSPRLSGSWPRRAREALHRREDGLGRCLAEPAAARALDQRLPQGLEVAQGRPRWPKAPDDLLELLLQRTLPARQGTHQPQDSSTKKSMKFPTTSKMSRPGPKTMTEPPVARSEKQIFRPNPAGATQFPDGPPTWTAWPRRRRHLQELGQGQPVFDLVDARAAAVAETLRSFGPGRLGRAHGLEPGRGPRRGCGRPWPGSRRC